MKKIARRTFWGFVIGVPLILFGLRNFSLLKFPLLSGRGALEAHLREDFGVGLPASARVEF